MIGKNRVRSVSETWPRTPAVYRPVTRFVAAVVVAVEARTAPS